MKAVQTSARVTVDFSTLENVPLSKDRIAIYNSGLVPIDRYERDESLLARVGAESLRIDLGWGAEWMPRSREVVRKTADGRLRFDFEETDAIARLLTRNHVRPYWSYCYVPAAARPQGGNWRGMAADDSVWVEAVRAYVTGAAERGVTIGYHEVYNEPDLRDERTGEAIFYTGDLDDYLQLYRKTSRAIRAADPSARIGGPALAVATINAEWLRRFLAAVQNDQLPLDFLSFHAYGTFSLQTTIDTVLRVLDEFTGFEHLELHLNEYNAFPIDYPRHGPQDTHQLASAFAADLPRLLGNPALSRVSWAQFLDSGQGNFSGMVDIDGKPKPIYRVYEFYQAMPVDRRQLSIDGPSAVGGIASSDGERSAMLLWNRHFADVDLSLRLDGTNTAMTVSIIDATGQSEGHPLAIAGDSAALCLRQGGVAMIESDVPRSSTRPRIVTANPVYRDRTARAWTDVDEATATVRFGTVDGGVETLVSGVDVPADVVTSLDASIVTADGRPALGSLVVREQVDGEVNEIVLGEPVSGMVDWERYWPARPVPAGQRRVMVALQGARLQTFATVRVIDEERR